MTRLALISALLALTASAARADEAPAGKPGALAAKAVPPSPGENKPGIEHYRRWSDKLGQGAQPEGDLGFETLKKLGFTTVLSVDGAAPDVAAAKRAGLKYVHVPIGYDGVSREEALEIIQAVRSADGPVYVHCHHGLHRGPAAAAIAREGVEGVTNEVASQGLKESGCSPNYAGLYRDVAAFAKPTDDEMKSVRKDLPEAVVPSGLRELMTHVDEHFDLLTELQPGDFAANEKHPDVDSAHEAAMLENSFRGALAMDDVKSKGDEFIALIRKAQSQAQELEDNIRAKDKKAGQDSYAALKATCTTCHKTYRN